MLDRRTDYTLSFFARFCMVVENFQIMRSSIHDLSWDFGHDVPNMGWRIDVNNEGGLDTLSQDHPPKLYQGLTNWTWGVPHILPTWKSPLSKTLKMLKKAEDGWNQGKIVQIGLKIKESA